jgi:beta-lactamase class A
MRRIVTHLAITVLATGVVVTACVSPDPGKIILPGQLSDVAEDIDEDTGEDIIEDPDDILGLPKLDTPDITSWEEFEDALADTGAEVSILATREDDGSWETVHATSAQELRPLGSSFKLYVLGAVQQAVLHGNVSWSDEVTVTDDLRSLPTGELQDEPEGTTVTVSTAAEKMISISDNTATEMLIDLVGRDAVEDTVAAMGHDEPAVLQPFLTTREFFQLGWSDPGLRETWREASARQRYAILDNLPGGKLDVEPDDVTDPVWPFDVQWSATSADITAAHRVLQDLAAEDDTGTVRDLLALNRGVSIDADAWPYVAFKGGSAPGVFTLTWYAEDPDGVAHTFVFQLRADDPGMLADTDYLVEVAEQGFELLS